MTEDALPNLIVIGAMKSGTTSLHEYLSRHPEIFMSETKELNYFVKERTWGMGLKWYRSQFRTQKAVRGESSQNYTKVHCFEGGVAARIKETLGEVRLVYLVRDPIERIVSHYHEAVEGGTAPSQGLNAFVGNDTASNHYVLTSSYHFQLRPYLRLFDQSSILVLALEDLRDNRLEIMNQIFRFLQVSEISDDSVFNFVRNTAHEKRSRNAVGRFLISPASRQIRAAVPRNAKDWLKGSGLLRKVATNAVKHESLNDSLADRIREILRPDIASLRSLTGQSFDKWSL